MDHIRRGDTHLIIIGRHALARDLDAQQALVLLALHLVFVLVELVEFKRPLLGLRPRVDAGGAWVLLRGLLLIRIRCNFQWNALQIDHIILVHLLVCILVHTRAVRRHPLKILLSIRLVRAAQLDLVALVGAGAGRLVHGMMMHLPILLLILMVRIEFRQLLAPDFINALHSNQIHLVLSYHLDIALGSLVDVGLRVLKRGLKLRLPLHFARWFHH